MITGKIQGRNIHLGGLNRHRFQGIRNRSITPVLIQDSFRRNTESSLISEAVFADDISEKDKAVIVSEVLKTAEGKNTAFLGAGADGAVYQIDASKKFAVKISHRESKNPITGEMQRTNAGFETEMEMLKLLKGFDNNSQGYAAHFKLKDGRTALVTTMVEGKAPGMKKNEKELNKQNLASILDILYKLDEKNILHRDLKQENMKISGNNTAGILDFGAAVKFNPADFKVNTENNNFPIFELPSNLRNFEDTLLSPYLNQLSKTNPKKAKELFTEYLKLKSGFHAKKARNIIGRINDSDAPGKDDKSKLKDAADYELTLSEVFKNPDDDIIETELQKNNITYNAELAYKNEILLLNPLANAALKINALISAKRLEKLADKNLDNTNSSVKKKYYEYKSREAVFRQEKIGGWTKGLMLWLINCLTSNKNEHDKNIQNIVEQCCNPEKDLSDFEIPNLQSAARAA